MGSGQNWLRVGATMPAQAWEQSARWSAGPGLTPLWVQVPPMLGGTRLKTLGDMDAQGLA